MAKHNNTSIYPFNTNLSLDDGLFGFAKNNFKKSRNHKLGDIVSYIVTQLELSNGTVAVYIQSNKILSGGYISWNQGLSHHVTSLLYIIQSQTYSSEGGDVIFSDADDTYDRFDAIVADTQGNVLIIEGEPSEIPAQPVINEQLYVLISYVKIEANSPTVVNVDSLVVYRNYEQAPNELIATANNQLIVLDNPTDTQEGTACIYYKGAGTTTESRIFSFKHTESLTSSNYTVLEFYIKLNTYAVNNQQLLTIGFSNQGAEASDRLMLQDGLFNYDDDLIGEYQRIIIPISSFSNLGNTFDELKFYINDGEQSDWFIDTISLISGVSQSTNYTDTFLNLTDVFESSYVGKENYQVFVNETGTGLVFKKPYWQRIEDADVHKADENEDDTTIEHGDIVRDKIFTKNGTEYLVPYATFEGPLGTEDINDIDNYILPILFN